MVLRLRKALYGSNGALHAYYHCIYSFFKKQGLQHSQATFNLFTLAESLLVGVIIYVDSLIISVSHKNRTSCFMADLSGEFEITDQGLLHYLRVVRF